jgi:ADP-ribosylation factor 2-binding protein
MNEQFKHIRDKFFKGNCMEFENSEENKLEYTEIFKQYSDKIESHMLEVESIYNHQKLVERVSDFSMEEFTSLLNDRRD